jgi:hypothetical protein
MEHVAKTISLLDQPPFVGNRALLDARGGIHFAFARELRRLRNSPGEGNINVPRAFPRAAFSMKTGFTFGVELFLQHLSTCSAFIGNV